MGSACRLNLVLQNGRPGLEDTSRLRKVFAIERAAPTPSCCHPTVAVHVTEVTLLASLIAEHVLAADRPTRPSGPDRWAEACTDRRIHRRTTSLSDRRTTSLSDAHRTAAKALTAWRAAAAMN